MNLELSLDKMKLKVWHISLILSLATLLLSSCNKEESKVIPRGKLSQIYAEMLLTDQWLDDTPSAKSVADTSLVYEPILEKYGYTKLDYIHTIDRYLDDPERFARIWRETSDLLDKRLKEAKKRRTALQSAEDRKRERLKYAVDFNMAENFPCMFEEPYIHYHDSLAFQIDSAIRAYKFADIVTVDTTYEGVVMHIRVDSLAVADTVAETSLEQPELPELVQQDVKKTIKHLKSEKNLPLRQVNRPELHKAMDKTEDLKLVE